MSEQINQDELNGVSGGAGGATGERNKGNVCIGYVCDVCGAVPSVCDYDVSGRCASCEIEHSAGCAHGSDIPKATCKTCTFKVGATGCSAPGN